MGPFGPTCHGLIQVQQRAGFGGLDVPEFARARRQTRRETTGTATATVVYRNVEIVVARGILSSKSLSLMYRIFQMIFRRTTLVRSIQIQMGRWVA